ncbi:cation channel sperm-associated protein 1 [Arvicola amphibius]|uniref:cation channel sperm-associated protein 1 n=1 Tax=Arvicola amphibius TaxID=1047088 RepID=UPI001C08014D|nr:cation channel sperm-associated protein 1 [Arvicola amphibius]
MDQPSKMDEAHREAHTARMDTGHHSHSPYSHVHYRSDHSGVHYPWEPPHPPSHHHGGFHHQNESWPFRESSDSQDGAFFQESHHYSKPRLSTASSIAPYHLGGPHHGSHPHTESHNHGRPHDGFHPPHTEFHHHGGPQDGSHSHTESHHHHHRQPQDGHHYHRGSEASSHFSTASASKKDASHQGKSHESHHQAHHNGRFHPTESQHHEKPPHSEERPSHQSFEGSSKQGRPHPRGSHHAGLQATHHHGERPHHREHRYHKEQHLGEYLHPREHFHHHYRHTSQISVIPKSRSTIGVSPSTMGAKSSVFSVPRSHMTSRSGTSRVSSRIHPKESSEESISWSEDDHIQKRKRTQRTHKKMRSGNIFQLIWGKICHLIWGLRQMMMSLTQSLGFETFIFIVVCLNTVILVAQTFTELEIRGEWYFMVLDSIFLSIYILEAVLKLIALGMEYFYDPWNNLDFFIMVMAVLDFVLVQINALSYSFYNHSLFRILKVFKSMRALRAIRVLRRLSILTSLHEVTGTLSGSLPSITAILTLMFTCLFLFSVVLRALFRKSDPKRFQNIFTTLFTLFTMLTLDDWSLIYMDSRAQGAWYIIPILMIYIIIQYFIFLNLVIAVLVDNFQMALLKGLEKVKLEKAARVHEKLLDDSLTELNKTDADVQMSDSALQAQFIERMFSTMTERQRELHFQYLQLVASVEQHQQKFRSQASVIDEIVDTAFEAGEEDFGK